MSRHDPFRDATEAKRAANRDAAAGPPPAPRQPEGKAAALDGDDARCPMAQWLDARAKAAAPDGDETQPDGGRFPAQPDQVIQYRIRYLIAIVFPMVN